MFSPPRSDPRCRRRAIQACPSARQRRPRAARVSVPLAWLLAHAEAPARRSARPTKRERDQCPVKKLVSHAQSSRPASSTLDAACAPLPTRRPDSIVSARIAPYIGISCTSEPAASSAARSSTRRVMSVAKKAPSKRPRKGGGLSPAKCSSAPSIASRSDAASERFCRASSRWLQSAG